LIPEDLRLRTPIMTIFIHLCTLLYTTYRQEYYR